MTASTLRWCLALWLVFFSLLPLSVAKGEDLVSVLEGLKVSETSRWAYRETRKMALLRQDWEANGYLYFSSQWIGIRQLSPTRTLVLLSESELRYAEPQNQQFLRRPLSGALADASGAAVFLRLARKSYDQQQLEKEFEVQLTHREAGWRLSLIPREIEKTASIILQGTPGTGLQSVQLNYVDGDTTLWTLDTLTTGEIVQDELRQMIDLFEQHESASASDLR